MPICYNKAKLRDRNKKIKKLKTNIKNRQIKEKTNELDRKSNKNNKNNLLWFQRSVKEILDWLGDNFEDCFLMTIERKSINNLQGFYFMKVFKENTGDFKFEKPTVYMDVDDVLLDSTNAVLKVLYKRYGIQQE